MVLRYYTSWTSKLFPLLFRSILKSNFYQVCRYQVSAEYAKSAEFAKMSDNAEMAKIAKIADIVEFPEIVNSAKYAENDILKFLETFIFGTFSGKTVEFFDKNLNFHQNR